MNIFITGTTGYIGGSVAQALIARGHRVIGLVRSDHAAERVTAIGIEPLRGSLHDNPAVRSGCATADVVINAADSDDPWVVSTMIQALEGTGKTLIHNSGSSLVGDCAGGELSEAVFSDRDPPRPVFEKAGRQAIDEAVLAANGRGLRTIVFCATMIYGLGLGPNRHSVHLPMMITLARESGRPRHVGGGRSVWSTVHIGDVVDAYAAAVANSSASGFFYLESGEVSFRDLAAEIGRALGQDLEPLPIDIDEAVLRFNPEAAIFALGSNSRVRGDRTREVLGWEPAFFGGVLDTVADAVSLPPKDV